MMFILLHSKYYLSKTNILYLCRLFILLSSILSYFQLCDHKELCKQIYLAIVRTGILAIVVFVSSLHQLGSGSVIHSYILEFLLSFPPVSQFGQRQS